MQASPYNRLIDRGLEDHGITTPAAVGSVTSRRKPERFINP